MRGVVLVSEVEGGKAVEGCILSMPHCFKGMPCAVDLYTRSRLFEPGEGSARQKCIPAGTSTIVLCRHAAKRCSFGCGPFGAPGIVAKAAECSGETVGPSRSFMQSMSTSETGIKPAGKSGGSAPGPILSLHCMISSCASRGVTAPSL